MARVFLIRPNVRLWIILPSPLLKICGECAPIQIQAAEGAAVPQFDDKPVEQRFACKAFGSIAKTLIEDFGQNCFRCRSSFGWERAALTRLLRLVERQDKLPGENAG